MTDYLRGALAAALTTDVEQRGASAESAAVA